MLLPSIGFRRSRFSVYSKFSISLGSTVTAALYLLLMLDVLSLSGISSSWTTTYDSKAQYS